MKRRSAARFFHGRWGSHAGIYIGRILKGEGPVDLRCSRSRKLSWSSISKHAGALGLEVSAVDYVKRATADLGIEVMGFEVQSEAGYRKAFDAMHDARSLPFRSAPLSSAAIRTASFKSAVDFVTDRSDIVALKKQHHPAERGHKEIELLNAAR